jgi:hypothetical protein
MEIIEGTNKVTVKPEDGATIIRIEGKKSSPEHNQTIIEFPWGHIEVTRVKNSEDSEYWVHVSNAQTPKSDNDFYSEHMLPNGSVRKGEFIRGRIDREEAGVESIAVDDKTYHMAFRLRKLDD